jgi:hypothetical protein
VRHEGSLAVAEVTQLGQVYSITCTAGTTAGMEAGVRTARKSSSQVCKSQDKHPSFVGGLVTSGSFLNIGSPHLAPCFLEAALSEKHEQGVRMRVFAD